MVTDLNICPLCGNEIPNCVLNSQRDMFHVSCDRCAEYWIHQHTVDDQDMRDFLKTDGYILSGLSRELNEKGLDTPEFNNDNIHELSVKHHLLPPRNDLNAKVGKLLDYIASKTEYFGERIDIYPTNDYPISYSKQQDESYAFLNLLEQTGYIEIPIKSSGPWGAKLSASGWESTKSSTGSELQDRAFIASWFDDDMDETIATIKKALSDNGYDPKCLKGDHFSDPIYLKALNEIKKSKFIIADLTGMRHSVFFEIGYAHALGKDIIYVYSFDESLTDQEKKRLEFYVGHYQCHKYTNPNELSEILNDAIGARIK